MSFRARERSSVSAVPNGPDPDFVPPESRRTAVAVWSLREAVLAGAVAVLAVCGTFAVNRGQGPSLYGHVALFLMPVAIGMWMLLRPLVRGVNGRVAGLNVEQWATAVSLNALLYSLVLASADMSFPTALAVLAAAAMTAATAFARWIPAFSRDLGHDFTTRASAANPKVAALLQTTALPSVGSTTATTAFPAAGSAGTRDQTRSAGRADSARGLNRAGSQGAREERPQARREPISRQPFWFAVPERGAVRDARTGVVVGHARPGIWILAREDWGDSLVVELEDGARGTLADLSGIERA